MNRYEQKQERRKERLTRAAERARQEAAGRLAIERRILDAIPMGQPILVGHHSERRHRRDLARAETNLRKGIAAQERAADLEGAAAAVGTAGISSDDPDAIAKIDAEILAMTATQERMKAANAAIRKAAKGGKEAQVAALVALGIGPAMAAELVEPDFMGRIGFADYQMKNNGANLRRLAARRTELGAREAAPVREPIVGDGWRIEENRDLNRVQIFFDAKPSDATRTMLKSRGFRWAPTEGAWQRQMSNGAWHHAQEVVRS